MEKVQVRCWRIKVSDNNKNMDDVFVTYPENNLGHDLISCLNCGEIYAVDISKEVYVGPAREELLKQLNCKICGKKLFETSAVYPERYRNQSGQIKNWERGDGIPPDDQSEVLQFYGIYS